MLTLWRNYRLMKQWTRADEKRAVQDKAIKDNLIKQLLEAYGYDQNKVVGFTLTAGSPDHEIEVCTVPSK